MSLTRLLHDLPLGTLCAVDIPEAPPEPGDPLWEELLPEEHAHLATLPPARQPSFAAGRVALGAALQAGGFPRVPLLSDPRGAPQVPPGALGSISHKRKLAVGLAAPAHPSHPSGLGVDLEELRPLRVDISRRVLTPAERAQLEGLVGRDRDAAILLRFSLKEAFFKAANGLVAGSLSFEDLTVVAVAADGMVALAGPALERHGLVAQAWAQASAPLPGYIVSAVQVAR